MSKVKLSLFSNYNFIKYLKFFFKTATPSSNITIDRLFNGISFRQSLVKNIVSPRRWNVEIIYHQGETNRT